LPALAALQIAVLGLEAWDFPAGATGPLVKGLTSYEVNLADAWGEVVRKAKDAAIAHLGGLPTGDCINVTWLDSTDTLSS
jgi:hypothetical protein